MNIFSLASDEVALLNSEQSISSLVIAPTSHSNIGRFFNSPCRRSARKIISILPKKANMESLRMCIEGQIRFLLKTICDIKKGEHLVWDYNYK